MLLLAIRAIQSLVIISALLVVVFAPIFNAMVFGISMVALCAYLQKMVWLAK